MKAHWPWKRASTVAGVVALVVALAGIAWVERSNAGNRFTDPSNPICETPPSDAANVRTDCEFAILKQGTVYSNETTIAVNPTRPVNIVAAADDIQILVTEKSEVIYRFPRVRASEDGGRSWTSHPVDWGKDNQVQDVGVAFDQRGVAYLSVLSRKGGGNPDIKVTHSGDGGRHWSPPSLVAAGSGTEVDGVENDKVALAAWGPGNAVVAWTQYQRRGGYGKAPIMASLTHDGGVTWSTPIPVSGSAPSCVGTSGDHACDQAQNAQPVVTADGHLLVSFMATVKAGIATNIEPNTLMVVELDPLSGAPIAGPYPVAKLSDGASQYPANASFSLPTLHDSQFIVSSVGTIAADPTNPAHLAEVWSDMRNSPAAPPPDPYAAATNADVSVAQSFDWGRTWSAPVTIALPGDQFQPGAVYDRTGRLRLGYYDRSFDPANDRYGYSLATERSAGSLGFDFRQASTALSDPTRDDHVYAQETINPAFPHPTGNIGDYSALAATPTGVIAYWTDLRDEVCFGGRCDAGQSTYVANLP